MTSTSSYALRHATTADAGTVAYLSGLDDTETLRGDVLLAFDGDRAVAALSTTDGRVAADPFVRTAAAVDLLRRRAREEERSGTPRRRFGLGGRRSRLVALG